MKTTKYNEGAVMVTKCKILCPIFPDLEGWVYTVYYQKMIEEWGRFRRYLHFDIDNWPETPADEAKDIIKSRNLIEVHELKDKFGDPIGYVYEADGKPMRGIMRDKYQFMCDLMLDVVFPPQRRPKRQKK